MKRILVPTDFSKNAYCALFYATRLYQNQACQFIILHTFEVENSILVGSMVTSKGSTSYQKLQTKTAERLEETLHAIVRDTEDLDHTFETLSVSENLITGLKNTIVNKKIDMVVMGTKGATGAKAVFMGSNTVNALQKIKDVPVLIIPNEADFKKPTGIAFPTGLNRFYYEKELRPLIAISSLFGTKIRILHINDDEEFSLVQKYNYNALSDYLKEEEFTMHWIPRSKQKTEHINDFIEQFGINLLVMINYKNSFLATIMREAVIKKMGFKPTVPFLVIPEHT